MAALGVRNQLPILRETTSGLFLDGGEDGEILLPGRYIPANATPGTVLDVFIYRDSEDRLVATTETPLAMVGDFATLRVVSLHPDIGAFLDWGLAKDLLLPRREQAGPVRVGQQITVRVFIDERSNRIVASMKLNRWLERLPPHYRREQPVEIMISNETPLGYNAIVEGRHKGLLYHDSLASPLRPGETMQAFVSAVRANGKIDLTLDRAGYVRVKPLGDQILQALTEAGGKLPFHDKSSPEEIRATFGVSKKAFKQALGALYRKHRIALDPTEIRLLPEQKKPARGGKTR